jgi:hypothetical protein
MFDANTFKKAVKEWIRANPTGTVNDILDYCEEQIPPAQYASYEWLVNQTIDWYKHILTHREASENYDNHEEESTV